MLMPWAEVFAVDSHYVELSNSSSRGSYVTKYYYKGHSFYVLSNTRPLVGSWYKYRSLPGKNINRSLRKSGLIYDMYKAFLRSDQKSVREVLLYLLYDVTYSKDKGDTKTN